MEVWMTSDPAHPFSPDEFRRYGRHLVLPEVGLAGQRQLKTASVLVVGTGGLGSPLAMYLAAAGVGHLGLVDFDVVDLSNLQRQVLHGTPDVGRKKLASARDRLQALNPAIEITLHETALTAANALTILRPYAIVADGTDNYPTRYLVNDACVLLGKANVYGSIFRFEGQASVFDARRGPCYRCLFPEPPPPGLVPSCAEGGVLGVLPGVIGTIQAVEAVKLILGRGEPLIGRLLLFDALAMRFREVAIRKDPGCPLCGDRPTIRELIDYEDFCGVPGPAASEHGGAPAAPSRLNAPPAPSHLNAPAAGAPTDAPAAAAPAPPAAPGLATAAEITPRELAAALARRAVTLIDVREPAEWAIARIEGARLIPLGELPARLAEIPLDADIVLYCHHGVRSLRARAFLRQSAGCERVWSLRGGIDAWSADVDPGVPRY
jgi:adenylyltransferase/sulfurtransferase